MISKIYHNRGGWKKKKSLAFFFFFFSLHVQRWFLKKKKKKKSGTCTDILNCCFAYKRWLDWVWNVHFKADIYLWYYPKKEHSLAKQPPPPRGPSAGVSLKKKNSVMTNHNERKKKKVGHILWIAFVTWSEGGGSTPVHSMGNISAWSDPLDHDTFQISPII